MTDSSRSITDTLHAYHREPLSRRAREAASLLAEGKPLQNQHIAAIIEKCMPFNQTGGGKGGRPWMLLASGALHGGDLRLCATYHSDGTRLYALDGNRIHVIKEEVEEGIYSAITNKKLNLPQIIASMHVPEEYLSGPVDDSYKEHKHPFGFETMDWPTFLSKLRPLEGGNKVQLFVGIRANLQFMKDAVQKRKESVVWVSGELDPIYIFNDFGMAVIMPMRK